MANRSYLYSALNLPHDGQPPESLGIRGISEFNYDIPLIYKLLVSGHPQPCRSLIWPHMGDLAIAGDFEMGVARLKDFLTQIKNPDAKPLIDEALEFLAAPTSQGHYFILECGEIYEMIEGDSLDQNQQLLNEIQNLNPAISQTLSQLQPSATQPQGFWSRMFGSKAPTQPPANAAETLEKLGLGNWSSTLYYSFDPDESNSE